MSALPTYKPDPRTDLVLERFVDVPRELVWAAWTQPEHLKEWFCPLPWKTVEADLDLRPGGIFRTVMRSPEGEDFPHLGCYLEVVPKERLVWTDALLPGFRPAEKPMLEPVGFFTAIISMVSEGKGTRYKATAIHRNPDGAKEHEKMGFHEGWGTALDQLVALAKKM